MKRILLWSFDRGSLQYDVMCGLILAFLFLIPRAQFTDVPDFMKATWPEPIHKTEDRNGNAIFTVKLKEPAFLDLDSTRQIAYGALGQFTEKPIVASRTQPVRDWTGRVVAYAVWIER